MTVRRILLVGALLLSPLCRAAAAEERVWGELSLLQRSVVPGHKERLSFLTDDSFIRDLLDVRVLVARGATAGPTLCVTAAVHGDEINGVEIARRVFDELDVRKLSGTLVAVPIVNVWGLRSGNRLLPDRRDLNRAFPGSRNGSLASRVAAALFQEVIRHCDALIDLHTGSGARTNLPQIRVDLGDARARKLAEHFGVGIVLAGAGPKGTLRRAAGDAGIPTILYEAGGPHRFEREEIARGVEGVNNLLEELDMVDREPPPADPQRIYQSSSWVRAPGGGIFLTDRSLGERIEAGALLGSVSDPVTSERVEIRAPFAGTLIGMAFPKVVLPGFGLFHVARHEQGSAESSETEE
jgi:predicted deacylase